MSDREKNSLKERKDTQASSSFTWFFYILEILIFLLQHERKKICLSQIKIIPAILFNLKIKFK